MKVAVLTIWHEKNYGAELQAYATIKMLQNLGHTVQMIDIRLSDMRKVNFKQRIVDAVSSFGQDERSFNRFWRKYIPTTRRYKNIEELKKNPPKADIYLVGSDQVWNPDITKRFAPIYFLDFAPNHIPRISYASSFGSEECLHQDFNSLMQSQLRKFCALSCREESGVIFLKQSFGLDAKCVVDPTLLLTDYSELIGDIQEKETLVYYPLSCDEELESYSISLANRLSLVPINNKKEVLLLGKIPWKRVRIEDWIKNIGEAKFVITRSFHGLVFCLLYKRQFAILASRNGRGDRLINLLKMVKLEDRLYSNVAAIDKDKPWLREIDYDNVVDILKVRREESINYLIDSFKNVL